MGHIVLILLSSLLMVLIIRSSGSKAFIKERKVARINKSVQSNVRH